MRCSFTIQRVNRRNNLDVFDSSRNKFAEKGRDIYSLGIVISFVDFRTTFDCSRVHLDRPIGGDIFSSWACSQDRGNAL